MARVLIVGRGAPERGGIRSFIEMLLESELAGEHELEYLNVGRPRGGTGGEASLDNVKRTAEDLVSLWKHLAGHDVLHIHSSFAPTSTMVRAIAFALVGRLRRARAVIHVHGGQFPGWVEAPWKKRLVRFLSPAVSVFVPVAMNAADTLKEIVSARKVRLIHNGVDLDLFHPLDKRADPPAVLFVGVLTARKGLLELFTASRNLRERGVDHQLWIVGGVPDEGFAQLEEVEQAAPEHAEWFGELDRDTLHDVYSRASIYCLPSWWEAAPLTVLEAMASGLPIVASRVGEVPRMVEEGVSGLLQEPKDAAALERNLAELLQDPGRRAEMGARSRRRAEDDFDLKRTVREMDDIYSGR